MELGNDISLLNFKTFFSNTLTGRYSNCERSFPISVPSKRTSHKPSIAREK